MLSAVGESPKELDHVSSKKQPLVADLAERRQLEAEAVAAFKEKLEDLSPAVRRSQANRKRRAGIEARRAELEALILAEVPAAVAAARQRWPDDTRMRKRENEKIAERLLAKGYKVGRQRIQRARKGR